MQPQLLPRHELWRRWYRLNRYCSHLHQKELNQRIRDIFLNMMTLQNDGKIGMVPLEDEGAYWIEIWTHVLEEMSIRFGPYPSGFTRDILHSEPLPDLAGELASRTASLLSEYKDKQALLKFGKLCHMQDMYDLGAIRVQSASYYSKPDHNGAVRDDELALGYSIRLTEDGIRKIVKNPKDVPNFAPPQRIDIHIRNNSDYWLYCLSMVPHGRLFVDFNAEACVVIHDVAKFSEILRERFLAKEPNANHRSGKVEYLDPLILDRSTVDVPFAKHFRFQYQKEFRHVWLPDLPANDLPHVDLELGSIKAFATLIKP